MIKVTKEPCNNSDLIYNKTIYLNLALEEGFTIRCYQRIIRDKMCEYSTGEINND